MKLERVRHKVFRVKPYETEFSESILPQNVDVEKLGKLVEKTKDILILAISRQEVITRGVVVKSDETKTFNVGQEVLCRRFSDKGTLKKILEDVGLELRCSIPLIAYKPTYCFSVTKQDLEQMKDVIKKEISRIVDFDPLLLYRYFILDTARLPFLSKYKYCQRDKYLTILSIQNDIQDLYQKVKVNNKFYKINIIVKSLKSKYPSLEKDLIREAVSSYMTSVAHRRKKILSSS